MSIGTTKCAECREFFARYPSNICIVCETREISEACAALLVEMLDGARKCARILRVIEERGAALSEEYFAHMMTAPTIAPLLMTARDASRITGALAKFARALDAGALARCARCIDIRTADFWNAPGAPARYPNTKVAGAIIERARDDAEFVDVLRDSLCDARIEVHNAACADGTCVACCAQLAECVPLPCRHICMCMTCARRLDTCPVCRATCARIVSVQVIAEFNARLREL